mmetsp:Transcript_23476/g.36162  ORF Transcript_23476/g.36162 Transcript_23476/m.36162 type:complete len:275 (-) Transcript_23476:4758-5582(-)
MVQWADPAGETEEILGYALRMTDVLTEEITTVYNTSTNQDVREFLVTGLVSGRYYKFQVKGINFNGEGETWSDEAKFSSCTAPTGVPIPTVTEQTQSQLSFSWDAPTTDGGCDISTYKLYVDDKSVDPVVLTSQYSGLSHVKTATVSLSSTYVGQKYRYYLEATNEIGSTQSLVGYVLFAAVPDDPPNAPTSDATVTNSQKIKVDWSAVLSGSDGGDEVLSYSLEKDDGAGGDFVALTGTSEDTAHDGYLKLTYTVTEDVTEGVIYRFRYRCKN